MKQRTFHRLAFTFVVLLGSAMPAFPASLADYKQRLTAARAELTPFITDEASEFTRAASARIQTLLPDTEKIELPSGTVEAQNGWLGKELGRAAAASDAKERVAVASAIDERLSAILNAVETLERATAGERTKDEDKQKLAEILRRPEYQQAPPLEESLFQKWWREFNEWLSKQLQPPEISPDAAPALGSIKVILQILVLAAVIGLIGFLFYRFVPAMRDRWTSRDKNGKGTRVILGEQIEAHESARDLLAEAERLAREGDLRGAIRKGYVAVLCDLSDRRVIALARHKTNRDYLRDVRRNEGLFNRLRTLTGAFESSWYGLRPARPEEWESFRDGCREAVSEAGGRR
jgi:hypothetical protein